MERELPLFEAKDARGAWAGSRTAWQRKDMLALAPHEGCSRCEAVLSALWRHGHPDDVAPFVVRPEAKDAFDLSDPERTLLALLRQAGGLGAERAVALVADRYAQLYAAVDLHDGPEAEACARDIADWVLAAQKACAECSAMPREDS
jgi:hypothetical protein